MVKTLNNNRIKITFTNGFVKIVEKKDIKNFNSLIDWMDNFNNNLKVPFLTLSGRDLGSTLSLNPNNVKHIEFM